MVNTPLQSTPTMRTMYHRRTLKHPHPHTNHIHGASLPVKSSAERLVQRKRGVAQLPGLDSHCRSVLCDPTTGNGPRPTSHETTFPFFYNGIHPPARARALTSIHAGGTQNSQSLQLKHEGGSPLLASRYGRCERASNLQCRTANRRRLREKKTQTDSSVASGKSADISRRGCADCTVHTTATHPERRAATRRQQRERRRHVRARTHKGPGQDPDNTRARTGDG